MHEITIYHHPGCGTSRNTLALIRHAGFEPTVVEYLQAPPTRDQLRALAAAAGVPLRELLREKGTPYAELGLGDPALGDDALLDAIERHPILLNRPIVVTPLGTRLCRPSEAVLALLPCGPLPPFTKEDGERIVDDGRRRPAAVAARHFGLGVAEADPLIADAIAAEQRRQQEVIELIASENIVSRAVLEVQGSILTNKTVEGLPGKRYHAGAAHVDVAERAAIERACQLFGCRFANVQPHSGSQANHAVLHALAEPGDTILSMDLNAGGHLSHGAEVNLSGKWFRVVSYGVRAEDGLIDPAEVEALAREHRPKLVIAGGSAYARALDFAAFRRAADAAGARLLVDMAHFAGLVAGGVHADPFPFADVVTTTTYKSLRGPRGAVILWNDPALTKRIDNAVFPGLQGTPYLHVVAAKAVALGEALRPEFRDYAAAVLANARALAARLQAHGHVLVGGGTDTPLMLVDLRPAGLRGDRAAQALERAGLVANANPIPSDAQDRKVMSGLRFGVSGVTTRGLRVPEIEQVGDLIAELLAGLRAAGGEAAPAVEADVARRARALALRFPIYGG